MAGKHNHLKNYDNVELYKINDAVKTGLLTQAKIKAGRFGYEDETIDKYNDELASIISAIILQSESNSKRFSGKRLLKMRALIMKDYNKDEAICLEKILPVKIIVKRFIHMHSAEAKKVNFDKELLVQVFVEKISYFIDKVYGKVVKLNLSRSPESYKEFAKLDKYIRSNFDTKETVESDKLTTAVLEDLFINYRLEPKSKKLANPLIKQFKLDNNESDKRDSLLEMEESRLRQLKDEHEKDLREAEAQRIKLLEQKKDTRSVWAKYIDLCLERDDIFQMKKEEFNKTFGIEEPENIREVKTMKKMSQNQIDVLKELYSFSAYIKRDIATEGRSLKKNLELNERKVLNDDSEDGFDEAGTPSVGSTN